VVLASYGDPPPTRTGRSARRQQAQPLSAREQELAALVLSEHTVHAHVRNLLAKLGLASRTQIAAWVPPTHPTSRPSRR
jgi:DNA-binding CsgD family transcriptional regulator